MKVIAREKEHGDRQLIVCIQSPAFIDSLTLERFILLGLVAIEFGRSLLFISTATGGSSFYSKLTLLMDIVVIAAIGSYLSFTSAYRRKKSKRDMIVHNISSQNAQFFTMIEDEVFDSIMKAGHD
jgi:hypothetical protein